MNQFFLAVFLSLLVPSLMASAQHPHKTITYRELIGDSVTRKPQQPMLLLRTDALRLLCLAPNIQVEFLPPSGRLTAVVGWTQAGWRLNKQNLTWIAHSLLAEMRIYLKDTPRHNGHFLGIYGHATRYDVQLDATHGWISPHFGQTWGTGLTWGCQKRIKQSRWKWEVYASVGFLHTTYDTYHVAEPWAIPGQVYYDWHSDPALYHIPAHKLQYLGPTRIGFSIAYELPWPYWKKETAR